MSIFEIIMLICFGLAWPTSIWKSWTSRATAGKSLPFMIIVFFGYVSGMLHKVFYHPDNVIFLYIFNGLLVAIDILLYFRNRWYERNA
ncbi:MAG: hypothetical protein CSA22_10280 [Deltaproteobacteria bacterium]|nr:MAG: hypothetical protein CSA22_10280 [Deltaproteobacteria bacterium]